MVTEISLRVARPGQVGPSGLYRDPGPGDKIPGDGTGTKARQANWQEEEMESGPRREGRSGEEACHRPATRLSRGLALLKLAARSSAPSADEHPRWKRPWRRRQPRRPDHGPGTDQPAERALASGTLAAAVPACVLAMGLASPRG